MDGHSELKRQSRPPAESADEVTAYEERYCRTGSAELDDPEGTPQDHDAYKHRRVAWDGTWPGENAPRVAAEAPRESLQLRAMGRTWWLLCECQNMDAAQEVLCLAATVGWGKNEPAQYMQFARITTPLERPGELGYMGVNPETGRVLLTLDVATCDDERPALMSGAVVLAHLMGVALPYVVVRELPTWTTAA